MAMVDVRRQDERDNIRGNPFWMSSAVYHWDDGAGMDDNQTVLFSFPKPSYWIIDAISIETSVGFVGGTNIMTIGNGTIVNDELTDGATVTPVTADSLGTDALISPEAVATVDLENPEKSTIPLRFKGAIAAVPVIYITLTSDGTVTAGTGRVHIRVSEIDENIR